MDADRDQGVLTLTIAGAERSSCTTGWVWGACRAAAAPLQRLAGADAGAPSAAMSTIPRRWLYVNHGGSPPLLDRCSRRGTGRAAPTRGGDTVAREGDRRRSVAGRAVGDD